VQAGQRVLDVACGTGVLAREAHARTGPTGYVAGLDVGPGMLAVAQELDPAVDWRPGRAEALPFPDESFDAVVSQFGLMFFTDREQAVRETARVLEPGGRLAVAVWDTLANILAFAAEVELLERLAGPQAADAVRAPFALGDRERLVSIFQRADLPSATVATHPGVARFPSIRVMVEADLRGWLPVMGVNLSEDEIERILQAAERELAAYVTQDEVVFEALAHLVTATK
jgi:SAM-dependent methyltransferase